MNVNDAGSTNSATGTLAFASPNETVSGLGFAAGGSFSFNTGTPGTSTLNVSTGKNGTAGVTTNVNSTPSTLSTKITGGANTNTYNIASSTHILTNVAGPVTIVGGSCATSAINLDDQSSGTSNTYTVTSAAVTSSATFGGLTYSSLGFLTLNAGTNPADVINVNSTLNGITTNITDAATAIFNVNGTGTGGTLTVATGSIGGSTVNVVADSELLDVTTNGSMPDTVNIGAAGGTGNLPGITGPVTLIGNTNYVLAINDQGDASAQTYNVDILTLNTSGGNTGSVALGSATPFLSFTPSDLTSLTFNGGNLGNTIDFNDVTPDFVTTQINAGAGNDTTNLRGSGLDSTVNLDSEAGSNTVTLGGNTVSSPWGARQLPGPRGQRLGHRRHDEPDDRRLAKHFLRVGDHDRLGRVGDCPRDDQLHCAGLERQRRERADGQRRLRRQHLHRRRHAGQQRFSVRDPEHRHGL